MSKRISIIVLCIMLCFFVTLAHAKNPPPPPPGHAYGHNNPQNPHSCCPTGDDITNNYEYNNYNDMDYDYDVDQTYNYDQSMNITTNNYLTVDNSAMVECLEVRNHIGINSEADTLLNTRLTDAKYYGTPWVMPAIDSNVVYSRFTILHFSPKQVVAQLGPGEFSQFNIAITSDKPIKLYLSANRTNIKVLTPEIIINRCNGVSSARFIVTLEKGVYWTDGLVTFRSEGGADLGSIRIVFENKRAIDHISRVTMDDTYTTIGHGMRQNRGTWGWSGFVGVRVNRETNEETAYGTLTYDW